MRVLITGGGGFLAGHLSDYLQTIDGVEVCSWRRADCDLSVDKERLSSQLRSLRPKVIFPLAGRINGSEFELDRDNRLATANLLESAREEVPAARIVFGSTAAVYGEGGTSGAPLEESQPVRLRGPYATSKYAAEQETRAHADAGGWIATARMSNPIGSGMDSALLCGTLAKQIVEVERGKPPVITLRDLEPKRDFISARDCAEGLRTIAQHGECGKIYNLARGESISIREIVEVYLSLAQVRPIEVKLVPVTGERSTVREQWVSNHRMRMLGWVPRETLRDAVEAQLKAERARG